MLKLFFSNTRRMIALAGIGLFTASSLIADVLPFPSRNRPRPAPIKVDPSKQQPVVPMPMKGTMYGRLIWLGQNATKDANYALCRKDGEKLVPVCYVKVEGRSLGRFENHEVKATGLLRTMKAWSCPLLVVENIINVEFLHPEDAKPKPPEAVFAPVDPFTVPPPPKTEAAKPLLPEVVIPPQPLPQPEASKPLPPEAVKPQPLPPEASKPLPSPAVGQPLPPSKADTFKPIPPTRR